MVVAVNHPTVTLVEIRLTFPVEVEVEVLVALLVGRLKELD